MDLKDAGLDLWYRAVTALSVPAVIGSATITSDAKLRNALVLIFLGAGFVGIGEWRNHPYQERIGMGFKISGNPRRFDLAGTLLIAVGLAMLCRGVWLLH